MGILNDIFRTTIVIDGNEAINQLGKLQNEAAELKHTLKETQKENKVYQELTKEVSLLEKQYKTLAHALQTQQALFDTNAQKIQKVKDELAVLKETGQANTQEFKQLATELKQLEFNQTKYTTRVNEANTALQTNRQAHNALQTELSKTEKLTTEWVQTSEKLDTVSNKIKEMRESLGLQGLTPKQLREYRAELQRNIDTVTFGTAQYEKLKRELNEVNTTINRQRNDLADNKTQWQKLKENLQEIRNMAIGNILGDLSVRAFDGLIQGLAGAVTNAAKLSDELADIERFTGLDENESKALNSKLSKTNTRTSTGDLRQIAIGGGALGVPKEEIADFVVQIDKANVALSKEFGGNAENVTLTLGKLKAIFKETQNLQFGEAMSRIASALTAAGAASSAAAPEVASFTQRMGQLGELGTNLTDTLGLGAALTGDLGLSAEIASGGLINLFITAGKETDAFAAQIGITKEKFLDLLNNNPNEMLLQLAKSMKGLNNDQVVAALSRMNVGSQEAVKVMALLKDNTAFVVQQQKLMATEFEKNTMLQEAFNARMKTFGATLDLAKKEINGLTAGITNALLPILTALIAKTVQLVILLKELPTFLKENRNTIIGLTVALIGWNLQAVIAQANALRIAFNFVTLQASLRAVTVVTNLARIAQTGLNVALTANPIGLVITAIGLLITGLSILYEKNETVRKGLDTIWAAFRTGYEVLTNFDFSKPFDSLIAGWEKVKKAFNETLTPKIAQPNLLINPTTQQAYSLDSTQRTTQPQATPNEKEQSEEDKKLAEENRKRAAELAAKDKDKQKDTIQKATEERKKLIVQAEKEIAALRISLLEEGFSKELAILLQKQEEEQKQLDEAVKKGLPQELAAQQQTLLNQNFEQNKKELVAKYRQIGIDKALAEAEAYQQALQQQQQGEVTIAEADKSLKDAQAQLTHADQTADNLLTNAQTPEEQNLLQIELDKALKDSLLQNEIEFLEEKYRIGSAYKDLTTAQETDLLAKIKALQNEKTANERANSEERKRIQQAENQKVTESINKIGDSFGQISQGLNQLGAENTIFSKTLAAAQIAINTATSISTAIAGATAAAASKGAAAPFVLAGYIASMVGAVVTAVVQAKNLLNGAETPKAPKSKTAAGGGQYFDGGHTGTGNPNEVAGIVHKDEYVIPSWLRKVPQVANFEKVIESVRKSKDTSLFNSNPNNQTIQTLQKSETQTPQENLLLIAEIRNLATQVQQLKNIKATVSATEVHSELDKLNTLDELTKF